MMDRFQTSTSAHRSRWIRLEAALLCLVWIASGVGVVSHDAAHEEGSAAHVEQFHVDPLLNLVPAHGHGHTHESDLPDASLGQARKVDAPALLLAVQAPEGRRAGLRSLTHSTPLRDGLCRAAGLGPRAPPIS